MTSTDTTATDSMTVLAAEIERLKTATAATVQAKRRAQRAKADHSRAHVAEEAQRRTVADAIVAAAQQGHSPAEIRRLTGYTRQRIQQICRAAGVPPFEG